MDLGNNYFIRYADEILSRPRKLNERKLLQYVQNLK